MIAKDYKQKKESVLAIYQNKFLPLVTEACNASEVENIAETRIKNLKAQAENIKADKFILMVAGEAKSGKSTFINAFLGIDILPMDVMQCTSAIVEIKYAPDITLNAIYANGTQRKIEDKDSIKRFLSENAAVDDKYREIPVSIINQELIVKKRGKAISDKDIASLIAWIRKDKPSGMSDDEYKDKVVQYINEKRDAWQMIIKKIEIGCPFNGDMRGITIVDSPGVGAEGHVGDVTYNYINKADAIIFLKSIQGQDIASSSFNQFIANNVVTKKKDVLFLALTRIGGEPKINVNRVHQEAIKLFQGNIQQEQILTIDSKAQMFYNQIRDYSLEDIDNLIDEQIEKETLDGFIENAWHRAKNDRDGFLEGLNNLSRFKSVNEALNRFARKAHYSQLSNFLDNMLKSTEQMSSIIEDEIDNYLRNIEDPEKFDKEIKDLEISLRDMQSKMGAVIDDIPSQYANSDGKIEKRADEVIEKYENEVNRIDLSDESGRFQKLEELTLQQNDVFLNFQNEIREKVIAQCNRELVAISNENRAINLEVIKPGITSELIESIKESERNNPDAIDPEGKEEEIGYTIFKTKKKVPAFSEDRYYEIVKDSILKDIKGIRSICVKSLRADVDMICHRYQKELEKNIDDKIVRLTKVNEDKRSNDEKREKVRCLREVLSTIKDVNEIVKAEKEGVE